ncbi:hypothetical protein [Ralstonia flaminis]|jgi:hypothetical protein|uniref:hypothetical protein n=1 Tax=Ralstonia flaminis TaxID=3058597 RepID=UPI002931CDF2|nr:hypothetical protein [Ralstonia sp. LMG 18101]
MPIAFGSQRNGERARLTQRADDVRLVVACVLCIAEGGNSDGFDGRYVGVGFGADQHM